MTLSAIMNQETPDEKRSRLARQTGSTFRAMQWNKRRCKWVAAK